MHLIEIFLPLADNDKRRFAPALYEGLRSELGQRFGGVTVFSRAPAEGEWVTEQGASRDDIFIFEVMAERLDRAFWTGLRRRLEQDFRQESVLIRATRTRRL